MKTFDDFAKDIGFNTQVLDNYISYADNYYNTYYIPKRDKKKKRVIDSPSKELKAIQRWILTNYLNGLPISNHANGFVKGRGIKRNAQFHLNKLFILSIDIKDFFPSTTQKQVFDSLSKHFEDKDLCLKLAKLCTFKRRLPQGAPTSPVLSNIVFKDIDDKVERFCNTKFVVYSRYADDLVFSCNTKSTLVETYSFINNLLPSHGYFINKTKTRYLSGKGRMSITGVNINDGKLTVQKDIKRNLRCNIFNLIVKKDTSINTNKIAGYLSFIKYIEPDHYEKMVKYIKQLKARKSTSIEDLV